MSAFRRSALSSLVVGRRFCSSKPKVLQRENRIWDFQYQAEGKVYTREEGSKTLPVVPTFVSADFFSKLTKEWDISWTGIINWHKRRQMRATYHDQRFIPERLAILGPDLAAAHFIVARGGGVRFAGQTQWIRKDDNDEYTLPRKFVADVTVEAIDLRGVPIIFEGMIMLVNLRGLRWLSFRSCENFDDWFCDWLGRYAETLEYLDIGGCKKVTERGVSVLHRLENLKTLVLDDLPNFQHRKLVCLLLNDVVPECRIIGIDSLVDVLRLPDSEQAKQQIAAD